MDSQRANAIGIGIAGNQGDVEMLGPSVLARTISETKLEDSRGRRWQYHSRSDSHSKIACWTLLLDALLSCDALQRDARAGRLGFALNHQMIGPINKTLDLVLTRRPPVGQRSSKGTFASLVERYKIAMADEEATALASLPPVYEERRGGVSEVVVAVEAKACMTKHVGSLPRLHAEILATGYLAKRAMPRCAVVSYTMINAAASFRTPSGTGVNVNDHNQPTDVEAVANMLRHAVPLARDTNGLLGYDAVGAIAINCANDESEVTIVNGLESLGTASHINYDRMVTSLCSEYRARYTY